ncbi:hypothetical protein KQI89_08745 [Clostridium sp. MSJ-4]|uniref:Uncharacterized protein n=1 Tax=Clostridium simiarum TaxID=2841506 RepID=A0ABS6F034_9CLOT|nr:hypothetical protein [Clostridium simiarum]MBU5591852.1 hypothetical protein [Clostridium simiarum]
MDLVQNGIKDRLKKINAIRLMGTGIDIGDLTSYAHEIVLYLLLSIFRREITENTNRTRSDMLYMVSDIIRDMNLDSTNKNIERLVDGLLWYKDPDRQEPFSCPIYNEETRQHEVYKFRYLKEDRENSHWEQGGSTVYMLTEEAQEIIFITREMLEEFGFDVEQFYTLQLIKSGNFNKALNSISNLIARVKTLIRRERDYRQDMIRSPQIIFFDIKRDRRKSEQEIKNQFDDEKKNFEDMLAWKNRLESFPKDKRNEAEKLFREVEKARVLHNQLAKIVIDNIAYEVRIRVNYPESFWVTSRVSFKKDIWQNIVAKNGLPTFDLIEALVAPILSPKIEFIYPLDWAWEEQIGIKDNESEEIDEISVDEDEEYQDKKVVNWELILQVWQPIFDDFIEGKGFCITELKDKDVLYKEAWLSERKNVEIFMMFVITSITFTEKSTEFEKMDERMILFNKLCRKNEKYKKLIGKTIVSRLEEEQAPLCLENLFISPYKIFINN